MSPGIENVISKGHTFELVDRGLMFRNFIEFELLSATSQDMLMVSPDRYTHIILNAEADGDVRIYIYIEPTVTDTGDEENSGNFNLNFPTPPLTKFYTSPVTTDDGTYLARTKILGGSGVGTPSSARASGSMIGLDMVLIPNTTFMIRYENLAGRDVQLSFEATFAERKYDSSQ